MFSDSHHCHVHGEKQSYLCVYGGGREKGDPKEMILLLQFL